MIHIKPNLEIYYTKNSDCILNGYYLPMIPRDPQNTEKIELEYLNLPLYESKSNNIIGKNSIFRTITNNEDIALANIVTPNGILTYNLSLNVLDHNNDTLLPLYTIFTMKPIYKSDKYLSFSDIQITIEVLEEIRVITIICK